MFFNHVRSLSISSTTCSNTYYVRDVFIMILEQVKIKGKIQWIYYLISIKTPSYSLQWFNGYLPRDIVNSVYKKKKRKKERNTWEQIKHIIIKTTYNLNKSKYHLLKRLLRWLSGKESTCQCRSHGFNTWVSNFSLEEERTTNSNILARIIPWTEEFGRL